MISNMNDRLGSSETSLNVLVMCDTYIRVINIYRDIYGHDIK